MIVELPFRPPLRFEAVLAFLATRALEGIDRIANGRYERRVLDSTVTIERGGNDSLRMTVPEALAGNFEDLTARAVRTFDLTADPAVIDSHLSRDAAMGRLLRKIPGTRVPGAWDPFEVAVRAVVGQQISVRAATTIMKRIVTQFDGFPTPQQLVAADISTIGMPRARIAAIQTLASAIADDPAVLTRGATLDESIGRLVSLPGIGAWTAHYIAMRVLREPDAFPHSDLGLRKAAGVIGIPDLAAHAERWRPWRAYAAIALWESL